MTFPYELTPQYGAVLPTKIVSELDWFVGAKLKIHSAFLVLRDLVRTYGKK